MFGSNDNQQANPGATATQSPSMLDNVIPQQTNTVATTPTPAVPAPIVPSTHILAAAPNDSTPQNPVSPTTTTDSIVNTTATVVPGPSSTTSTSTDKKPAIPQPVSAQSSGPVAPPTPIQATPEKDSAPQVDMDKLADMKKQALDHLEPLVKHLDGTPEETFKTTMMMIQANDNHTLLDKALNAAKKITDDKERAQALLDIVNEINYFSQNSQEH